MIDCSRKQQFEIGERTGGRHRASGLTELLARALRDCGREVEVEHLHVHLPRVLKTPAGPDTKQETA
ncbi:hypothetical protein QT196_38760 (plasmid) [Streptomyces sp. P9-2B-2]|uniref:hypothetical protein n=1 Tax=Streptomyces sp. P9-2B-2 TaxID=3057114 RepID=UPI0025B59685|nr:hypothetical protein [Streptomyces sp. P9-2B-2]WJY43206.1 hypothetical protein QT196_38760 [Streptomyces sp. P9-2B-2]